MIAQLLKPKSIIKAALLGGKIITTSLGNRIARTVDFRKIISRLRAEGMNIQDEWLTNNGRRFKKYWYVGA